MGDPDAQGGSIPACAGEPRTSPSSSSRSRVYPRVCGGTVLLMSASSCRSGLSPRVRGNRLPTPPGRRRAGSIPACAGEPQSGEGAGAGGWVYPRVCGGTPDATSPEGRRAGLSPRVRGNRRGRAYRGRRIGSIPACAGEPWRRSGRASSPGVYPRVCGGTRRAVTWEPDTTGLSPRVRGNRRRCRPDPDRRGSIPACAGEP